MDVEMVIADLDNTLLRSDKTISARTASVFSRLREKGIKTAYATARSARAAKAFMKQFEPDIFIGYGGALTVSGGAVISRFAVPAGVSYKIINDYLREPDIFSVHAVNESAALTNRPDESDPDTSYYKYFDFTVENGLSYLKITLIASDPEPVFRVAAKYPEIGALRYTGEDMFAVTSVFANKWNAIKVVSGYFGIDINKTVAFGDDVNDIEMLKNCGTGVAMENAVGAAKDAADHICGGNDKDGAAEWIEENIL